MQCPTGKAKLTLVLRITQLQVGQTACMASAHNVRQVKAASQA